MDPFWERTAGPVLAQGDLLTDCLVPLFAPGFGTRKARRKSSWPRTTV